jgi:hypothetical protein
MELVSIGQVWARDPLGKSDLQGLKIHLQRANVAWGSQSRPWSLMVLTNCRHQNPCTSLPHAWVRTFFAQCPASVPKLKPLLSLSFLSVTPFILSSHRSMIIPRYSLWALELSKPGLLETQCTDALCPSYWLCNLARKFLSALLLRIESFAVWLSTQGPPAELYGHNH